MRLNRRSPQQLAAAGYSWPDVVAVGAVRRDYIYKGCAPIAAAPHALDVRATLAGGDAFALTSTRQRGRVDGVAWDFSVEPVLGRRRRRATGAYFSGRGSESFNIRPCRPS